MADEEKPKKSMFEVEVHGIPFDIKGVDSEDQAIARVLEAAQADPDLFRSSARELGMMFDEETQIARERSEVNKFIIGAGKSVSDTIDMVHTAFLEQTGADFQELRAIDERIAAEQQTFDKLADTSLSADAGEVSMNIVSALGAGSIPGAALKSLTLVRGMFGMAKFLSPFVWFRKAGNAAMNAFAKQNITGSTMQAALQTTRGQATVRAMQQVKNPSDKALAAFAKNIRKAADDFTPTP